MGEFKKGDRISIVAEVKFMAADETVYWRSLGSYVDGNTPAAEVKLISLALEPGDLVWWKPGVAQEARKAKAIASHDGEAWIETEGDGDFSSRLVPIFSLRRREPDPIIPDAGPMPTPMITLEGFGETIEPPVQIANIVHGEEPEARGHP